MNVNRSGYYKWLGRGMNKYGIFREFLLPYIQEIHKYHKSYGYHDIASKLRDDTGLVFSDNLIHKICKYNYIKSKAKHYRWNHPGEEHIIFENKIKGNWNASKPMEILVSDMTTIIYRGRKYEWTFVLDTFNNSIIASSGSFNHGDIKPYYDCLDKVKEIIKKEEIHHPIYYHTDQGSVYSSKAYNLGCDNYNIIRSMSRAGTPTDNPIIESINGWIKCELYLDYKPSNYDSIEAFMKEYIYHFNYERPAYKLKYKSPADFTVEQGFRCLF
jgi:putative transposase